jgi:hypothetical protein
VRRSRVAAAISRFCAVFALSGGGGIRTHEAPNDA